MQIVCLISSLQVGGAERQLLYLASTLQSEGHEVEILYYHKEEFYLPLAASLALKTKFISSRGGAVPFAWRLARHLRELSCDLLFAFLPGASTKACLAHLFYPHFQLIVSERCHNRHYMLHDRLRFLLFRRSVAVVCNSHSQSDFIRSHNKTLKDRVVTITNFVDLTAFPRKECFWSSPRRILVTGRVNARKNILGLIRAAALLKSEGLAFSIDWYGSAGSSSMLRRCIRLIAEFNLEDCFVVHEAVNDVAGLYADADIFCLPSFYEGTSNSLAEALSSGLTVVCSEVCDNPRLVRDGWNGFLFNPFDIGDVSVALKKALLLNDDELTIFGMRSRSVAETTLNQEHYTDLYVKLVEKYADRKKIV